MPRRRIAKIAPRASTTERYGYQRAWKKRMGPKMLVAIDLMRARRAELLREADALQTAILSMERLIALQLP